MLRGVQNIGVFSSTISFAPPYNPRVQAMIAEANLQGYTLPSEATLLAFSNALDAIGDAILNKHDALQMYSTDASLTDFCRLNVIDPTQHLATVSGGITHGTLGFTGNGSTGYIDTGFAPSNGVNFQRDDACVYVYSQTNMSSSSTATLLGVDSTVGGSFVMMRPNAGGRNYFNLNNGDVFTANVYAGNGQIGMTRSSNADVQFNVDGVELDTIFTASRAVGDRNIFVMARNFSTGAIWHAPYEISYFGVGSFMSPAELLTIKNAFNTYLNR